MVKVFNVYLRDEAGWAGVRVYMCIYYKQTIPHDIDRRLAKKFKLIL